MTRYARIDLSQVPRPAALENLAYEALLAARMADLIRRFTARNIPYDVSTLETDPSQVLQEVDAFRETLVRARVNDAVLATSLIFAEGADLDVRAAEYHTIRADGELDASLRLRGMLAWEALSLGGTYGGYEYFARSAAPTDILDVQIYGHEVDGVARGEVRIVLLGTGGKGVTDASTINAVKAAFPRANRKVNDFINVVPAARTLYDVEATLIVPGGVDGLTVRNAQLDEVHKYIATRGVIGGTVTLGALLGALGNNNPNIIGVEMRKPFSGSVNLASPPTLGGGPFQAPICSGVQLDWRVA